MTDREMLMNAQAMRPKDLEYWKERREQIEQRIQAMRNDVMEMEKYIAECDAKIKELQPSESLGEG